jgi:hypothetical protein
VPITEAQVSTLQDGTVVQVSDAGVTSKPIDRRSVVETLVLHKICADHHAKEPFQPQQVKPEQVITLLPRQMRPSDEQQAQVWDTKIAQTEYVRLKAESLACVYGIPTTSATPNQVELREVYDNAVRAGAVSPEISFEQVAAQIARDPQFTSALGLRRTLDKLVAESDITVNPRYGELPFALLRFQQGPALEVGMGEPSQVVQDR